MHRTVAIEGPDGAGKSTQQAAVARALGKRGLEVVAVREPGGTRAGEAIRTAIFKDTRIDLDTRTEALLMFAARRMSEIEVVAPALEEGKWVLLDRSVASSIAYQGEAGGIGTQAIRELAAWCQLEATIPQLTIVLRLGYEAARARLEARSESDGRFEGRGRGHFEKLMESYLDQACTQPSRHLVIDATESQDRITGRIVQAVMDLETRILGARRTTQAPKGGDDEGSVESGGVAAGPRRSDARQGGDRRLGTRTRGAC